MPDVVVTVPKGIWWDWIDGGDPVGARETGEEWGFFLGRAQGVPDIKPGERVYVVAHGRLRGYSPLTRLQRYPLALGRQGGAVAVTIPEPIVGFRGWRYRWWDRKDEVAFPKWRTEGVPPTRRDPLLVEEDARAEDGCPVVQPRVPRGRAGPLVAPHPCNCATPAMFQGTICVNCGGYAPANGSLFSWAKP